MDVTRILFILMLFFSSIIFGQKSTYPKDTIYVRYENKVENKKRHNRYKYDNGELSGISFYIKDSVNRTDKGMSLFYSYDRKADTLCFKHLKNYHFSNLNEINEKRYKWIFNNKRPPADRNGVFQTYLIEVISMDFFAIYPVIWAGEGIID